MACRYREKLPFLSAVECFLLLHIVELVYWHIIKKQPAYKPGSVLPFARERLSFISSYCHQ